MPRRAGVKLDAAKLDQQLARRGVTAVQLAAISGVHETVISRARHGRALSERNLKRLATGLLAIPIIDGAELLLADLNEKIADAHSAPAISQEVKASASSPARRR